MLGNLFKPKGNGKQKFRRTYNQTDFGITANVTLPASTWTLVGSVTVPAQQEVTFGSNDPVGGASVAGAPCYVRFIDTSVADVSGKIRFQLTNANETNTIVVLEESTGRLSASENDRTQAVLLPEYPRTVGEDSKLQITVNSTSAVTLDYDATNSAVSIPVTVYQ